MKAVVCTEHGPPEALRLLDLPVPEPGPGEVRIAMQAAGVNFPDSLIIQNRYQIQPPLPFSPGSEVAGLIDAVGPGVTRFRAGDRVAAITFQGGFAEQVVVREDRVLAIPDAMPFDIAAGFTMVYGTAYHGLKQRAALKPGETVLVLGAAGGVGLCAVELAALMGAHVIAAASTAEKLDLARSLGAGQGVNYASQDLKQAVKALTGEKGVDVVFDPVGDRLAEAAFRTLGWNGRHLIVGFAGGHIPSLPLNLPLVKGSAAIGVFWGAFTKHEPAAHLENMGQLFDWYVQGRLRPHVSRHFTLAQTPDAIRWVMDRKAVGKVVVTAG